MSQNHTLFIQQFTSVWDASTKYFDPDNPGDYPDAEWADYRGHNLSVDNQWVTTSADGVVSFHFGSPYRKNVAPDGSFQSSSFRINPETLTIEPNPDDPNTDWYWHCAEFGRLSVQDCAEGTIDLSTIEPDGAKLATMFYHEVGLQY